MWSDTLISQYSSYTIILRFILKIPWKRIKFLVWTTQIDFKNHNQD